MKPMATFFLATKNTLLGRFSRFRSTEDGGMIIFTLILFILIMTFGGMAVDLMRYETTRAKLQGTLDRATLAAADLDQTLPPADVVIDYFAKAGMLEFLDGAPIVDQGINYRRVTANASTEMPLFFYDLPRVFLSPFDSGLTALTVSGTSTAEERVTDVEVSLVLDVSGSMDRNNRIQNLRPAARDFVTTVLANNTNAPEGLITISMIPYSAVVSTGTDFAPFMSIARSHNYSTCPLFEDDAMFETTQLDLTEPYPHVAHFDPDWYSSDPVPIATPWCHVGDHNAIIAHTTDQTLLHDAIDDLDPYGNTAIDMGMKWGVALLDPSTRNAITALSTLSGNSVPAVAAGRPEEFGQSDVLKVIVLMTDGANTRQYDLVEPFKSGLSYIWFNRSSPTEPLQDVHRNDISVQYAGFSTPTIYADDWFYINHTSSLERWRNHPSGFLSNLDYNIAMNAGPTQPITEGLGHLFSNNVLHASWQDIYAVWEHNNVNNQLLSYAYNDGAIPYRAGSTWVQNSRGEWEQINLPDYRDADYAIDYYVVNSNEANARLSDICQAARDEGILIYTVAFEAPSGGRAALRDCASSPSHYFDVNGTDISAAFSAIASDIRALKLTE